MVVVYIGVITVNSTWNQKDSCSLLIGKKSVAVIHLFPSSYLFMLVFTLVGGWGGPAKWSRVLGLQVTLDAALPSALG